MGRVPDDLPTASCLVTGPANRARVVSQTNACRSARKNAVSLQGRSEFPSNFRAGEPQAGKLARDEPWPGMARVTPGPMGNTPRAADPSALTLGGVPRGNGAWRRREPSGLVTKCERPLAPAAFSRPRLRVARPCRRVCLLPLPFVQPSEPCGLPKPWYASPPCAPAILPPTLSVRRVAARNRWPASAPFVRWRRRCPASFRSFVPLRSTVLQRYWMNCSLNAPLCELTCYRNRMKNPPI